MLLYCKHTVVTVTHRSTRKPNRRCKSVYQPVFIFVFVRPRSPSFTPYCSRLEREGNLCVCVKAHTINTIYY